MKGLATALLVVLVAGCGGFAGSLEMSFGAGPSAASLTALDEAIGVFNALILHLNETFSVHPDVSGVVPPMNAIGSALTLSAGESYRPLDWLAIGANIEYTRSESSTSGFYQGAEISEIDLDLDFHAIGLTLGARVTFLDVGLRLSAIGGVGWYHTILDRDITLQIPAEYPDAIAGIPPEGVGRATGNTFGFEAGIGLAYPVLPWLTIGTDLVYRSAQVPLLRDAAGIPLDLDGNGIPEPVDLDGIAVRLSFSIRIDLSLDGKGVME